MKRPSVCLSFSSVRLFLVLTLFLVHAGDDGLCMSVWLSLSVSHSSLSFVSASLHSLSFFFTVSLIRLCLAYLHSCSPSLSLSSFILFPCFCVSMCFVVYFIFLSIRSFISPSLHLSIISVSLPLSLSSPLVHLFSLLNRY